MGLFFKRKTPKRPYNAELSNYALSDLYKLSTDHLEYIYLANTAFCAPLPDPDEQPKLDAIQVELRNRLLKG